MRPIDTQSYAAIAQPASLGPAPQLQWLPIDQLVIDESYQRDITAQGRKNVRAIAENFSWTFFAPVIVSPIEGGRYAVIDGQHRTTAAALVGVREVPCALVIADKITQAKAFRAINAQVTKMHSLPLFHARVAAGDEVAVRAAAMADAAGVIIARYPKQAKARPHHETLAPGAVLKMAARNAEIGVLVLRALRNGSPDDEPLLREVIMTALFEVLVNNADWCIEKPLLAALEPMPVGAMYREAVAIAAKTRGLSACDSMQAAFTTELEKTFRKRAA
jgi:hypothetical protein